MRSFVSSTTLHVSCPDERRSEVELLLDGINSATSSPVLAVSETDQGFSVTADRVDVSQVWVELRKIGAQPVERRGDLVLPPLSAYEPELVTLLMDGGTYPVAAFTTKQKADAWLKARGPGAAPLFIKRSIPIDPDPSYPAGWGAVRVTDDLTAATQGAVASLAFALSRLEHELPLSFGNADEAAHLCRDLLRSRERFLSSLLSAEEFVLKHASEVEF